MHYRQALPQVRGGAFLTDGGLETTLVFLHKIDLPLFAAFPLIANESGRDALRRYFTPFLVEAKRRGLGFVLDTATWRANPDWAARLGFGADDIRDMNRRAVALAAELVASADDAPIPVVVNGVVGPRGDGYVVGTTMTADQAARYHRPQIEALGDGGADMVSAITMTYVEEAIGISMAARACRLPAAVSFTVETDGCLPSGQDLKSAIEQTDAATANGPAYYMINCAHPDHFKGALAPKGPWLDRILGIRANASRKSHAELDAATELDIGDPAELGREYLALRSELRNLRIFGGCCGTDHAHIAAICDACL